MLYGVRRDLQRDLVRDGYQGARMRLSAAEWYPYFMRRLAERPGECDLRREESVEKLETGH